MCKIHSVGLPTDRNLQTKTFDISQQIISKTFLIVLCMQKRRVSDSLTSMKLLESYRHNWYYSDNFL